MDLERFLKTDRCLWYMDIRTGSIVVGHFDVVFGFLGFLTSIGKWIAATESYAVRTQYENSGYLTETFFAISRMCHFNEKIFSFSLSFNLTENKVKLFILT